MDNKAEDADLIIEEAEREAGGVHTAIQSRVDWGAQETFGQRCKADWKIVKA